MAIKIQHLILTIIICYIIIINDHQIKCYQIEINHINNKQLNCTLNCMSEKFSNKSVINNCFSEHCNKTSVNSVKNNNYSLLKPFVWPINLLCRDHKSLTINFVNFNQTFNVIYVLKINNDKNRLFLSDSPTLTINQLNSNTIYNITGMVFSQQYIDNIINDEIENNLIVNTLSANHIPDNVTNLNIIQYTLNPDTNKLNAIIEWQQPTDLLCNYIILWHSTTVNDPEDLQRYDVFLIDQQFLITKLSFDDSYMISIQTFMKSENSVNKSTIWNGFSTPTCFEWYDNDINYCKPYKPENITTNAYYVAQHIYNLNITWNRPTIDPLSYSITIANYENDDEIVRNVSGNVTTIFLENIEIIGTAYEVIITAKSPIDDVSSYINANLNDIYDEHAMINRKLRIILSIGIPISFISIFAITSVVYTNRQRKIDKIRKRMKIFEDLNNNAPNDPETDYGGCAPEFSEQYSLVNDEMEVQPNCVEIFEKIGEGAFGYVRRGCLQPDMKMVAVKMLKNSPSMDEIREFFGEIVVMKSVGHHPNIVGIIGHSTKNIYEMMLLTEYCSEGNLLDFLRNIWQQLPLNAINSPILPTTPTIVSSSTPMTHQKSPELAFNFDTSFTNKYACEYKYVLSSPKICDFAVNLAYEHNLPLTQSQVIYQIDNVESDDKIKQIIQQLPMYHVENPSYIEVENLPVNGNNNNNNNSSIINDQSRKHSTIELSYIDLLQFAKQIAEGMEFLSHNRVVHRDLAARNVLVCSDKKVKISDFGLSRDIYQENMYLKSGDGKLPIKWLAIESMTHQLYTSHSDVWSYGVLLYEIMTLGSIPYPTIDAVDLLDYLLDGNRMDRPRNCDAVIYQLMRACWEKDPNDRPTFLNIVHLMDCFIANQMSKLM